MVRRVRFGSFVLAPDERRLLAGDEPVTLGGRAFDLLCALVEHHDRMLGKDELFALVWPGLVVEDNNLSVQISSLRRVLGAEAIATVAGRGYRFALPVDAVEELPPLHLNVGARPAPADVAAPLPPARSGAEVLALAAAQARPALLGVAPTEAAARDPGLVTALSLRAAGLGGQRLARATGALLYAFGQPRSALACAAELHGVHPGALRLAIQAGDDDTAVRRLAPLLARARPGQTLLSDEIALDVIPQLDGELQDLGDDHAADGKPPSRTFSLTASMPAPPAAPSPARSQQLKPTIAVLPFGGYGVAGGPLALGDVLTDQVIGNLSRSDAIHVISRLSTVAFRDRDLPLAQIAHSLGADYVVSGRHWQADGRLRVQAELADAASGRVLWAETVADHEHAVLVPDSTLLQGLVGGILRGVFVHELRVARSLPLPDLASHTLLLAAIHLLYRLSPRDFGLAQQALLTLHERAPRHPLPLAWLARWHLFRVVQRWSDDPARDGRTALDFAERALDIDPDSPLALTMLGNVHTSFLRDLDRADLLYDQALSANPNESLAWLAKGNAAAFRGDGAQAVQHTAQAVALSPLDPSRHFYLGIQAGAALTAQDFDGAITAARAALRLNHQHLSAHRVLSIALAMSGRLDEARSSARLLLTMDPTLNVRDYLAQSPGAGSGLAQRFAQALLQAGVPAEPGA